MNGSRLPQCKENETHSGLFQSLNFFSFFCTHSPAQPRCAAGRQLLLEKPHRRHHSHYEIVLNFSLFRGRFSNPCTVNPNLHFALWLPTTRDQNSPHSGEGNNSGRAIWERQTKTTDSAATEFKIVKRDLN